MKTGQEQNDAIQREILPIPNVRPAGSTTYDAKDPETSYPPIRDVRPPAGAPNVLVILLDDVGWIPAAARWSAPVNTIGMALLAFSGALLLIIMWPAMIELIGDGTLLAIIAVTLIGLALGHLLGGRADDDRTVLALATASRHPGVALAVAGLTDPPLAHAAVLLAVIVSMSAAAPYTAWRKRRLSAPARHRSASRR